MNTKFNRRSIRLKGYDYSQAGMYFVTVCTREKTCMLGHIVQGAVELGRAGSVSQTVWNHLAERYSYIRLDEFIIMPNHVHGIIQIVGAPFMAPDGPNTTGQMGAINRAPTLGRIMRTFKALSAYQIHSAGMHEFGWQRGYYEHVVRSEHELLETRKCIQENPLKWELDPENPERRVATGDKLGAFLWV